MKINRIFLSKGCPSAVDWQSLLSRRLPAPRVQEMEAHLDTCVMCTAVLTSLTPHPPALLKEAAAADGGTPATDSRVRAFGSAVLGAWHLNTPEQETSLEKDAEGLLPFERKGQYKSFGEIGRGGMGVVFKAEQSSVGRHVAVKMLSSHSRRSDEAIAIFKAEIKRLGGLTHSNIVKVYDAGEEDGVPYFSMELIEGRTLADAIKQSPIPIRQAAFLVKTIAEAVAHAHDAGVIHCDLKPGNVLLTAGLVPMVTDFGLATTIGACEGELNRKIGGTAQYMAPEQWLIDRAIDVRTDVYGLGAILYEVLTGRPPFHQAKDREEIKSRVLFDVTISPKNLRKGLPRDLEAICLRCLQKRPEDRYHKAIDVAEELGRWLVGLPVDARPLNPLTRFSYLARRNRTVTGVVAICLLSILALTTYGYSVRQERVLSDAKSEFERGVRLAEDGDVNKGLAKIQSAINLLPSNEKIWSSHYQKVAAAWENRRLRLERTLTHSTIVTAAALSPDGRSVLFGDEKGAVCLWDKDDPSPQILQQAEPGRSKITVVTFGRDGSYCAWGDLGARVTVWDIPSNGILTECRLADDRPVRALALLEDGSKFVTGCAAPDPLRLWEVKDGVAQNLPHDPSTSEMIVRLTASPEGSSFVAIDSRGVCQMWNAKNGRQLTDLAKHLSHDVVSASYSPDGISLALAGNDIAICDGRTGALRSVRVSKDGEVINEVAYRGDGGLSILVRKPIGLILRQATSGIDAWEDIAANELDDRVHLDVAAREGSAISGLESNKLSYWTFSRPNMKSINLAPDVALKLDCSSDISRVLTLTKPSFPQNRKVTLSDRLTFGKADLRVWNLHDPQPVGVSVEMPSGLNPKVLAVSPLKNAIAVGTWLTSSIGTASVLVGTFTENGTISFNTLGTHGSDITAVAFSRDGNRLISGSKNELATWDLATGASWKTYYPEAVNALAVSEDGERFAVVSDGLVRVGHTLGLRFDVAGHNNGEKCFAAAFSHQGDRLAVATHTGHVFVYHVDGTLIRSEVDLKHSGEYVTGIEFSRDDTVLYSATRDGVEGVFRWDTRVWGQIGPVLPFTGGLRDFGLASEKTVVAVTNQRLVVRSLHDK